MSTDRDLYLSTSLGQKVKVEAKRNIRWRTPGPLKGTLRVGRCNEFAAPCIQSGTQAKTFDYDRIYTSLGNSLAQLHRSKLHKMAAFKIDQNCRFRKELLRVHS